MRVLVSDKTVLRHGSWPRSRLWGVGVSRSINAIEGSPYRERTASPIEPGLGFVRSSPPWLLPIVAGGRSIRGGRWYLPADGPDEARELTGDGCHQLVAVHPACGEFAEAPAQSQLCFPGDIGDRFGQAALAPGDDGGDPRRVLIGPGGFDQRAPSRAVAGFGDRPLSTPST
jgi:hypothetical protein